MKQAKHCEISRAFTGEDAIGLGERNLLFGILADKLVLELLESPMRPDFKPGRRYTFRLILEERKW